MKKFLSIPLVFACLITGFSPTKASDHRSFIEKWANDIDQLPTKKARFEAIARPMDGIKLCNPYWDLIDLKSLYGEVSPDIFTFTTVVDGVEIKTENIDKTNLLMLAINHGYATIVAKLLRHIDDVNDPRLSAWGYRQPYFPTHMILAPPMLTSVCLKDRLTIVDLLGQKGADFNIRPGHFGTCLYDNPPLIVPMLTSTHANPDVEKLMARALLYGADPSVKGSSGTLVCINPTPDCPLGSFGRAANQLCEIAFDDYVAQSKTGKNFKLASSVLEKFKKIKEERLKQLSSLTF